MDPLLEIVVTQHGAASSLDQALMAIAAGAADFVLVTDEGVDILAPRVRRLLTRGRRHRLYMHLMASLYREARRIDVPLAERMVSMAPASHQRYIRTAPVFAGTLPRAVSARDVDLTSIAAEGPRIVGDPLGGAPLTAVG